MRRLIPFLLFVSSMMLWADNANWSIDDRTQGMGFSINSKGDFLLMAPSLNIENDGGVMISAYTRDNLELVRRLKDTEKLAIRTYHDNDAKTFLNLEFDLFGFKATADPFVGELWWWKAQE